MLQFTICTPVLNIDQLFLLTIKISIINTDYNFIQNILFYQKSPPMTQNPLLPINQGVDSHPTNQIFLEGHNEHPSGFGDHFIIFDQPALNPHAGKI